MSGSYGIRPPPTTTWVAINLSSDCAQFGRDSLFGMILGTEGWAAVISLIRRSPDLRWPKAKFADRWPDSLIESWFQLLFLRISRNSRGPLMSRRFRRARSS